MDWEPTQLIGGEAEMSMSLRRGTPADAPERPKEAGAYLPVHDLPPDRDEAAMNPAERARLQAELLTARDRQASVAATQNPAAK